MSGHDGFRSLGELLAGGDPRRGEAAFLQGLNTGSTIKARNATTTNALAQARLRVDEAKDKAVLRGLGTDVTPTDIQLGLGGQNVGQFAASRAQRQIAGFRTTIADPTTARDVRQFAGQAIEGKAVNPLQFGPGGEILTDIFSADPLGEAFVTPTGLAQIEFDEARARKADADAALAVKKRTNPELFKSSSTVNIGLPEGVGLGDAVAADVGESTIPTDIQPAEATGVAGFGKAAANTAFDIVNADLPFPDTDTATNALVDLVTRTQITGQQAIPGRPSNFLMQQLATFGVTPNDPFRGDQKSLNRLSQTTSFLGGEADRIQRLLNFRNGADMTKSSLEANQSALRAIIALKQDYDVVISRFDTPEDVVDGTSFTVSEQ